MSFLIRNSKTEVKKCKLAELLLAYISDILHIANKTYFSNLLLKKC